MAFPKRDYRKRNNQSGEVKKETIEEYLARGGKITVIPSRINRNKKGYPRLGG